MTMPHCDACDLDRESVELSASVLAINPDTAICCEITMPQMPEPLTKFGELNRLFWATTDADGSNILQCALLHMDWQRTGDTPYWNSRVWHWWNGVPLTARETELCVWPVMSVERRAA